MTKPVTFSTVDVIRCDVTASRVKDVQALTVRNIGVMTPSVATHIGLIFSLQTTLKEPSYSARVPRSG